MNAVTDFIFLSSKSTVDADCSHEIKTCLLLGRKAITQLKKQRHHSANKGPYSQSYDFSSSHAGCESWPIKKNWKRKNWCFWTVMLEKTLESPLDYKDIKSVNSKGNQSWIFTGRTDAEAETPILSPPDVKNWLIWKDPDTGKEWRWEKGMTEDEMIKWHCSLNGHEFE